MISLVEMSETWRYDSEERMTTYQPKARAMKYLAPSSYSHLKSFDYRAFA